METYTVKEIAEKLAAHKLYVETNGKQGERADFSGANLGDAYLGGANLCGANLRGANLRGANLCDANLCDANLGGASLCDANLCDANLCDANLCDAYLRGANLCGANLCDANLCDANLGGASLCDANLCDANLCDANLCGANLRGANLCDANLCGANLGGAIDAPNLFSVGPIGSRRSYTTFFIDEYRVQCGCWNNYKGGTVDEFEARVKDVHAENPQYLTEYLAAIAMFRAIRNATPAKESVTGGVA